MRIRAFHTEGFRIAAIFVAIFALSAAALTAVTIVIVNQGVTRGDRYATATLDAPLGPTLSALAGQLGPAESGRA